MWGCVVANPLPARIPGSALDAPDQRAGARRVGNLPPMKSKSPTNVTCTQITRTSTPSSFSWNILGIWQNNWSKDKPNPVSTPPSDFLRSQLMTFEIHVLLTWISSCRQSSYLYTEMGKIHFSAVRDISRSRLLSFDLLQSLYNTLHIFA